MSIDLTAAIQAAVNALHDRYCCDVCDPSYYAGTYDLDATAAVFAAAPLIEAAVLEREAQGIEAFTGALTPDGGGYWSGVIDGWHGTARRLRFPDR